jgi:hypothetical protein
MDQKQQKLIPFTKREWKGKEVTYRTDRINVKLNVNLRKIDEEEIRKASGEVAGSVKGSEIVRVSLKSGRLVLKVPEGTDIFALCEELSKRQDIAYAEPDRVTKILFVPNDTRYGDQWALSKINAEGAWDLEQGNADILIGILDTGISYDGGNLTHPDLDEASRYVLGTDFVNDDTIPQDGHGHGTHVAGSAAAESDNGTGIAGINWVSQVYICKIFDDFGNGSESDFESAVEEIVDFALANNLKAVLNLSAGWFSDSQTLQDACAYAHNNGMVLCVATGNEGSVLRSPAIHSVNFSGVIAVGATNSSDEVTDFSNVGAGVTVVAPGADILSSFPTYDVNGDSAHDYVSWDGTSMATPHVTGLASLVWSRESRLSNEQVRDVLTNTAVKLGPGTFDNSWGHGRIHAADAVAKAGWALNPVQLNLNFIDIPEGETQLRAIRIDVNSFHATSFEMTALPATPFSMYNYSTTVTIGKSTDYDTARSVYLWVKYTGTNAGDTANGTAQVRCMETGDVYDVTITANTIARPTCAMMLVLDKSGSMVEPSGVGSMTREEILKYSANIFMTYVRENNGVGMVTFDQDAYDLLHPLVGPFGAPDDPFDTARSNAITALGGYAAGTGLTSIGDGIERGHNNLSGVGGYEKKALIVFTDGHENSSKYITDVSSLINEEVFAVGLGTAAELNPAVLNDICNGHNGYLLLTDQLDDDDTFKLAKYFLQIQAGVNNEQVVVDPSGYITPGNVVKVPFYLNETDISVDTIVMHPSQGLLEVAVETPEGKVISGANLSAFPTVKKVDGQQVTYYRMTLPVSDGASINAQNGQWNILLKTNDKYYKRYVTGLERDKKEYQQAVTHGVKYTALVHAYTNLRMACTLSQDKYIPGATLYLRAGLTEYGVPLLKDTSVVASVKMPDGSLNSVVLNKVSSGIYEAKIAAEYSGTYTFTVKASGFTSHNLPFTREQVLTASVWKGGDDTPPKSSTESNPMQDAFCKILACFDKNLSGNAKERLYKEGFDIDGLLRCSCHQQKSIRGISG